MAAVNLVGCHLMMIEKNILPFCYGPEKRLWN